VISINAKLISVLYVCMFFLYFVMCGCKDIKINFSCRLRECSQNKNKCFIRLILTYIAVLVRSHKSPTPANRFIYFTTVIRVSKQTVFSQEIQTHKSLCTFPNFQVNHVLPGTGSHKTTLSRYYNLSQTWCNEKLHTQLNQATHRPTLRSKATTRTKR